MNLPFLKTEKFGTRTQTTFVGDELKIYLPSYYLDADSHMASIIGEFIESIGLFWFKTENKYYEVMLPIKFRFSFSGREKFKGKLKPELPDIDYDVFILKRGDAFVYDCNHKQGIADVEFVVRTLLDGGKIPITFKYSESINMVLKTFVITELYGKLGVPSLTYELTLSELYRNKKNVFEPFRKLISKSNSVSEYDYKMVKLTKIPELTSVFTGLAGEDSSHQIASAILRTREKKQDIVSPIEKIIKY